MDKKCSLKGVLTAIVSCIALLVALWKTFDTVTDALQMKTYYRLSPDWNKTHSSYQSWNQSWDQICFEHDTSQQNDTDLGKYITVRCKGDDDKKYQKFLLANLPDFHPDHIDNAEKSWLCTIRERLNKLGHKSVKLCVPKLSQWYFICTAIVWFLPPFFSIIFDFYDIFLSGAKSDEDEIDQEKAEDIAWVKRCVKRCKNCFKKYFRRNCICVCFCLVFGILVFVLCFVIVLISTVLWFIYTSVRMYLVLPITELTTVIAQMIRPPEQDTKKFKGAKRRVKSTFHRPLSIEERSCWKKMYKYLPKASHRDRLFKLFFILGEAIPQLLISITFYVNHRAYIEQGDVLWDLPLANHRSIPITQTGVSTFFSFGSIVIAIISSMKDGVLTINNETVYKDKKTQTDSVESNEVNNDNKDTSAFVGDRRRASV